MKTHSLQIRKRCGVENKKREKIKSLQNFGVFKPFSDAVSTGKSPQSPIFPVARSKVIPISDPLENEISGIPRFPTINPLLVPWREGKSRKIANNFNLKIKKFFCFMKTIKKIKNFVCFMKKK